MIGVGIVVALSTFTMLGARGFVRRAVDLMRTTHDIFAAASVAAVLLSTGAGPAFGASAAPIKKLTRTAAAAAAQNDAEAAATISGGDRVLVSNCRRYGRSAFKCGIGLIPESSGSRCNWTDTIRLVKGRVTIKYSVAVCSG